MSTLPSTLAPPVSAPPPNPLGLPAFLLRPTPLDLRAASLKILHPWHAIRTRSNRELSVASKLVDLDLEVYCPRFPAAWTVRGRKITRTIPYLATYLFARWAANDPYLWHELMAVPGVSGFLGGANPDPVPDHEILALRAFIGSDGDLVSANKVLQPRSVPIGTLVLVTRSAFAGHVGVVDEVHADGIFVGVKFGGVLGREIVITVPSEWCDRVEDPTGAPLGRTAQRGPRRRPSKRRRERS